MYVATSGGQGRGSGSKSKQTSTASANAQLSGSPVCDENSRPGMRTAAADKADTALAHQDTSAGTSPNNMGTDESDILEQLPLAERLAEKQRQRMLAEAAARSRSRSPAAGAHGLSTAAAVEHSCAAAVAGSAHQLPAVGSAATMPVAAAPAAAAAAAVVTTVARRAGRAAWARPLPRQSPAPADSHTVSLGPTQLQPGAASTLCGAVLTSRPEGNLQKHADHDALPSSGAEAVTTGAVAMAAPTKPLLQPAGQQATQPTGLQAELSSVAEMQHDQESSGELSEPEPGGMQFLIDIDDSPAPAGPPGTSHQRQSSPDKQAGLSWPEHATAKPQHSRLQTSSCTADDSFASCAQGCPAVAAEGNDGQRLQQEPFQAVVRRTSPSKFGSPSLGSAPIDDMIVPDTPPYSCTSQAGSPTADPRPGPAWLTPLLARHQPGQGRQYSPSMLGRPHGMRLASSTLQAAAAAVQSPHDGADAVSSQQAMPASPLLLPHHSQPEADTGSAAVPLGCASHQQLPVALAVNAGAAGQQQARQQAAQQAGPTQQAHFAAAARSPGDAVTATGVFADFDSQEAAHDAAELTGADHAQRPQPQLSPVKLQTQVVEAQPAGAQNSHQAAVAVSKEHASSDASGQNHAAAEQPAAAPALLGDPVAMPVSVYPVSCTTAQDLLDKPAQLHSLPQSSKTAPQQTQAPTASPTASGSEWRQQAVAAVSTATQAAHMPAATSKPGTSKAAEVSQKVSSNAQATGLHLDTARHSQEPPPNSCSLQPSGNGDDLHTYDDSDNWDWQPSQANFGYQDAFGASQASQGFGLSDSWGNASKPAWQRQQQVEADKPNAISSLPVKGCRSAQQVFQPTSGIVPEELPGAAAKHVPFSTKRMPLPVVKPQVCVTQTAKTGGVPAQLEAAPALLPVRSRPLPKQAPGVTKPSVAQGPPAKLGSQAAIAAPNTAAAIDASYRGAQQPLSAEPKSPYEVSRHLLGEQSTSLGAPDQLGQSCQYTTAANGENVRHSTAAGRAAAASGRGSCDAQVAASTGRQGSTAGGQSLATASLVSSRHGTTAAAHGSSLQPPAVATFTAANTKANTVATSPAAAIFGPHIAEATASQSHVRKKLCLRLGPRQADAAPAASPTAADSHSEQRQDATQDRQRTGQHAVGPEAALYAAVRQTAASASREQGASEKHEACLPACAGASVLSPVAATPAGKNTLARGVPL